MGIRRTGAGDGFWADEPPLRADIWYYEWPDLLVWEVLQPRGVRFAPRVWSAQYRTDVQWRARWN